MNLMIGLAAAVDALLGALIPACHLHAGGVRLSDTTRQALVACPVKYAADRPPKFRCMVLTKASAPPSAPPGVSEPIGESLITHARGFMMVCMCECVCVCVRVCDACVCVCVSQCMRVCVC